MTVTASRNREKMIDVPEQRSGGQWLEFRENKATGEVTLRGYAATYEPYDCYGGPDAGGWVEQLTPRSFDKTLATQPDVMLLVNHTGAPLARTKSGTMTLRSDRRGLMVEARLDPSDPDVQSLLPKMRRGDMDEMSFAFRVKDQQWNDEYTHRTISEVSLQKGDVSVVNYGMNPSTRVAVAEGVGTLAELSMSQLSELRNVDSGLISRAINNLNKMKEIRAVDKPKNPKDEEEEKKKANPFAQGDEGDNEDDEDEKKSGNPFASDDEDDDEEGDPEKKAKNPFSDEESDPDEEEPDDDEDDEDKKSAARALQNTLKKAMSIATDDDVRQLLARAQGQLNLMRGIGTGPTGVDRMLEELRKSAGIPTSSTVTENVEYLRRMSVTPIQLL